MPLAVPGNFKTKRGTACPVLLCASELTKSPSPLRGSAQDCAGVALEVRVRLHARLDCSSTRRDSELARAAGLSASPALLARLRKISKILRILVVMLYPLCAADFPPMQGGALSGLSEMFALTAVSPVFRVFPTWRWWRWCSPSRYGLFGWLPWDATPESGGVSPSY